MVVPPRILLADADQFFVAVARLADPEGAGQAALLIVGGAPGSRGVVCSASYETRAFGVRSAMPIARALRLCPRAMCIPVPRGACSTKSREIRTVLERFTPVVRGASVDEWYLDMGGTEALYHHEPLEATARRMRADGVTFTNVFQPGQVLFGKRRAYQRKVAVADFAGVCSGDIYVLETKDTQILLPELLPFICQTDAFFDHAVGTSAGSPESAYQLVEPCKF